MSREIISTDKAPGAVGAYSQGVRINNTYYFSGQIGLDPATGKMQEGFQAQLDQIMTNIQALLDHCQLKRTEIFKTTIFMTDLNDFPAVNEAYTQFFEQPFPARSCVQVSALPKGAVVEIEVMAEKE